MGPGGTAAADVRDVIPTIPQDTPELRARCRDDVEDSLELGEIWVLEDAGRPVASTSFNAALDEVVQVGGVWTPPELRGRGRAVVAASQEGRKRHREHLARRGSSSEAEEPSS